MVKSTMATGNLLLIFFLVFASSGVLSQDTISSVQSQQDSLAVNEENSTPEDDFSVFLLFFALVGVGFMMLSIGIGIALTALSVLIVAALISFGVLTTSVLVGVHQNSFIKGFRTFIVLVAVIGTAIAGGFTFWFVNKMGDWWSEKFAILSGAGVGLVAGLILGFIALYIFQKLTAYFKKKFN